LTSSTFAQFYEISIPGNTFLPHDHTEQWARAYQGFLTMNGEAGAYIAPVIFPDSASGLRVSRLSVTYTDNCSGYLTVYLYKRDRWVGWSGIQVASIQSTGASAATRFMNVPGSLMAAYGINNNRYAWYLYAIFSSGTPFDLELAHITIRYQ